MKKTFLVLHPAAGVIVPLRVQAVSVDTAAQVYAKARFGRTAQTYRYGGYSFGSWGSYYTTTIKRGGEEIPAGLPGSTDEDLDTLPVFLRQGLQVWSVPGWALIRDTKQLPKRSAPWNIDQLIAENQGERMARRWPQDRYVLAALRDAWRVTGE